MALGGNIRKDTIDDVPGDITRAGNAWGASTSGITKGKSVTWEIFGELNVPLLKDQPFFKELTLSAAGRMTSVKSTRASDGKSDAKNGNYTYKLGANWAINDWLRFRASYGTSFRAPALFEQFLASETSFPSSRSIDPCASYATNFANGTNGVTQRIVNNCIAAGIPTTYTGAGVTATAISVGGIGALAPETSSALVVGGILTPKFSFFGASTRLNISVDYFDIRVKGEIAKLGGRAILYGCFNSQSFPTDPLCALFTRGQTGAPFNIATVTDRYINISTQKNSGIDVGMNLIQDLGRLGSATLSADMTWQLVDNTRLQPTSPLVTDNGRAGSPRWVGDFRFNWAPTKETSFFYGLNVIGGTSNLQDFQRDNAGSSCIISAIYGTYCPQLKAPAIFYHNVSITQDVANNAFSITLGVSNLFNTRPPRVSVLNGGEISTLGPVIAASQYSFVGRRAFINVSTKF